MYKTWIIEVQIDLFWIGVLHKQYFQHQSQVLSICKYAIFNEWCINIVIYTAAVILLLDVKSGVVKTETLTSLKKSINPEVKSVQELNLFVEIHHI